MKSDTVIRIQRKWDKLETKSLRTMSNNLDGLVEMVQAAYGCTRDRAEREYHEYLLTLRATAPRSGYRQ